MRRLGVQGKQRARGPTPSDGSGNYADSARGLGLECRGRGLCACAGGARGWRARGAWVAARARGGVGTRGAWGAGRNRESSVPPRQSLGLSLSGARAVVRGLGCAGEVASGKKEASSPLLLGTPDFPDRPEIGSPTGSHPRKAGRFKKLCGSGVEISDPGCEELFKVWKIASVFVSIGSAHNLTLQTTMKNQDKKNGAAKQSGHTSNPKNTPGQPEAGPEGGQGRPSQSAPTTEAEGSTSQAPGKAEGVCQLCFSNGQGEEFMVRQSSFWG